MKPVLLSSIIASIALAPYSYSVNADENMLKDFSTKVSFRYRAESVDASNTKKSALANTLRTRLSITTPQYQGISAFLEGDNILHVTDDFYDKENDNTEYNVVLDQETTQFNQAYVQYQNDSAHVKLGNQRILLDNQRHVGSVGFRQDEATFDGLSVNYTGIANSKLFLAVINNRNTITNDNTEEDIVLANAQYQLNKQAAITGYYYGIDSDTKTDGATLGARSQYQMDNTQLMVELATQDQTITDTNPLYWHLKASQSIGQTTASLAIETLASDSGDGAFATPLGTNHKFLGWTDTYLTGAGANGIQDTYLQVNTKLMGAKLVAQLHHFQSDEVDADLGTEAGLLVAKSIEQVGLSLKVSSFNATADSKALGKNNVTKVWLTASASF